MSTPLAILARGDSYEALHSLVGLIATAAAMDRVVHVLLTFGPLYRFAHGELSEAPVTFSTPQVRQAYERGIDNGRIPDLDELLADARELGGERVKLYGCTTSVKLLHLAPDKLLGLDSMLGHAAFLRLAEGAQLVVT